MMVTCQIGVSQSGEKQLELEHEGLTPALGTDGMATLPSEKTSGTNIQPPEGQLILDGVFAQCSTLEKLDRTFDYTTRENIARHEMGIKKQFQSLVARGRFSDEEINRLGEEICNLMEKLFLTSRRGIPQNHKANLQMFVQRYLDPFPVIFEKVCEKLDHKGWVMTRLKRQSVRDRIRRQELQGYLTQETYVQIRRKRLRTESMEDQSPPEVVESLAKDNDKLMSSRLIRCIKPRPSSMLSRLIHQQQDLGAFDLDCVQ